jgi:uncharacterized protein with PQ loop repeat
MHRAPPPTTPHRTAAEQLTARLIYLVAIVGPFTATPQLYEIWFVDKSAAGVSILTWVLFLGMSLIWFTYGAVRRDRPIMISNGLWAIMELFIILGALRFFEDWL